MYEGDSRERRGGTLDQEARERIFESSRQIALEVRAEVDKAYSDVEKKIKEIESRKLTYVPLYETFNPKTLFGRLGYSIFRYFTPGLRVVDPNYGECSGASQNSH